MSVITVERQFEKIGARAKVRDIAGSRSRGDFAIDIGHDRSGEFFDLLLAESLRGQVRVVDVQPQLRHLLLMSDQADGKHKYLCGHDERHWFVAAVPEQANATNVQRAFDALKPVAVRVREAQLRVKRQKRNRRRNAAFVRQGEWFFVPVLGSLQIDERLIFRNEPIRRGGGKPHYCEELVRQGGELVYVSRLHRNGVTEAQYARLIGQKPELRNIGWRALRRNPSVFVRGKIRHVDHKTILLDGWHQVLMNTETQAAAMRHVAFID